MAGKRLYITIPQRDWHLIRHLAAQAQECPGMWARRVILTALYIDLKRNTELQQYDAELAAQERLEVLRGR